jgi:hypothetical protein
MNRQRTLALASVAIALAACAGQAADIGTPDLVEALSAGGGSVELGGPVQQAFFAVEGRSLTLNGSDVQVFEYPSVSAREADSALISPDGSEIGTTMVTWVDQPTFWAKGKLIVLYVGRDQAIIDLLAGALGEPITEPWPTPG